jgi:hypothetical protein
MGRRPKPVNGEIKELADLAEGLREAHRAAGKPPLRTLAMRAHYSASTLSEAASGRRLPSLPVVLAYVTACGADSAGWEDRWRIASAAVEAHIASAARDRDASADTSLATAHDRHLSEDEMDGDSRSLDDNGGPGPQSVGAVAASGFGRAISRNRRARTFLWAVCGTAVMLALAGYLAWTKTSVPNATSVAMSGPRAPARVIKEDTDPHDTGCDQGQVETVASANLYGPDRFFLGYVWLRYAPACGAMWTRFEPAAGMAEFSGAKVTIWLVRPTDGRTLRYDTPYLGEFVYGNMLQTSHGCLEAEATVIAPHPTQGPATVLPAGPIVAHAETSCFLPRTA